MPSSIFAPLFKSASPPPSPPCFYGKVLHAEEFLLLSSRPQELCNCRSILNCRSQAARLMAVASEGGSRHAAEVLDRLLENVCTVGEESVKEMTASLASVIAARRVGAGASASTMRRGMRAR